MLSSATNRDFTARQVFIGPGVATCPLNSSVTWEDILRHSGVQVDSPLCALKKSVVQTPENKHTDKSSHK